jgi:hypothetical protein
MPTIDPDLEKKIVGWVNEQYQLMRSAREPLETQWYVNMAYYLGKQYVEPQSRSSSISTIVGGRLTTPKAPPWRVRFVINRVRPVVRTELAKVTSQKPTVTVIPASSEDRDFFAAQAGEQIWDTTYRDKNIKQVIKRAAWWTLITGVGFVKCWWDPDKVDPVNEIPGSLCYDPVTPFHILVPDLHEEELEIQPYLMHIQSRSMDWIKLRYPQLGDVKPDTAEANDIFEDAFVNLAVTKQTAERRKACLVKEVWIKPGQIPQLPMGGLVTVISNKIVQHTIDYGWPYEHKQYPFAKIDHIPTGKFYPDSTIVDLISLQKELNRTRSQVIEAKNSMAKPRILAYKGSVTPGMITSQPGQVILVTPGFELPTIMPTPPLPSYVAEEIDRILADINDISGQHEVSKGQTPPGVTAATAISYLQEQDESMIAFTYDSVENAVEKIAGQTLCYVKQYWDVPRIVKVVGVDGSFDALTFKGADLGNNTDVKVEAGSSLPTSKAARQAFLMDLAKFGWITAQQLLDTLDMGGINKITDKIRIDQKQAQRENLRMAAVTQEMLDQYNQLQMQQSMMDPATGMPQNPDYIAPQTDPMTNLPVAPAQEPQPTSFDPNQLPGQQEVPPQPMIPQVLNPPPIIPVNTWDNHPVHIENHNNYRKSQAFEQLPEVNRQLFETHVQLHIAAYQTQMMAQIPQQGGTPQDSSQQQPQPTGQQDQQMPDLQQQQPGQGYGG